jgi:choline transport protein
MKKRLTYVGAFFFGIALFYSITDLDAVVNSNGSFPLAAIYHQATGTKGGTFCLLAIVFFSLLNCLVGTLLTCGRIWWSLARDKATPFPNFFSSVNEDLSCPIPATLLCAGVSLCLGAIPLGSDTAFTVLAGSFIILTSTSYALAIAPNLFTGRKYMPKGPFHLGSAGYAINAAAVILIVFFDIMYCFRKFLKRTFVKAGSTDVATSCCASDDDRHHELQQRHSRWCYNSDSDMVVYQRWEEVPGAECGA